MKLKELIKMICRKYGITRAELLNTSSQCYTMPRRNLAHVAIISGYSCADLERETNISRATWNRAAKAFDDTFDYKELSDKIADEKTKKCIEEVKSQAAEFSEDTPKIKKVLGFEISELDEIKYRRAIIGAVNFMETYGRGSTPMPKNSYGRIVKYADWYK